MKESTQTQTSLLEDRRQSSIKSIPTVGFRPRIRQLIRSNGKFWGW